MGKRSFTKGPLLQEWMQPRQLSSPCPVPCTTPPAPVGFKNNIVLFPRMKHDTLIFLWYDFLNRTSLHICSMEDFWLWNTFPIIHNKYWSQWSLACEAFCIAPHGLQCPIALAGRALLICTSSNSQHMALRVCSRQKMGQLAIPRHVSPAQEICHLFLHHFKT